MCPQQPIKVVLTLFVNHIILSEKKKIFNLNNHLDNCCARTYEAPDLADHHHIRILFVIEMCVVKIPFI